MTIRRFQVALSFPGEHREYVSQVAELLAEALGSKDKVFYDRWYQAELAQVDMDVLLQSFYQDHADLIVPFLCADYEKKEWCGLEWRAIKDLIKQRQRKEIMPMRFDDTPIPGFFGTDGYIDTRNHSPAEIVEFILKRLELNRVSLENEGRPDFSPTNPSDELSAAPNVGLKSDPQQVLPRIHSDRLPTVKGGFFGREAELEMLNNSWQQDSATNIIQFIAPGGTGKTKILRHWLDHTDGIDALIAWSFYSQGASEDKQTSATPFFTHAFEKLGSTPTEFATEEDKGDYLTELLRDKRCVLVLDGLEPLQHASIGMRGELKDRAVRQVLKSLAGHNNGLCIITTRIAVHELADRSQPNVISHDLQNLAPADGVELLQSLGVKGSHTELKKAVREYGCHALALILLGNVLRLRYQGDVQKRDTLKALVKPTGSKESRHAFKVMQAYEEWFAGEPELALLRLLGLFDHPIEQTVLQVLWDAQIPHLTAGIDEDDWLEAIAGLREEHHLLSQHDDLSGSAADLDCHPLIHEYFGKQLQSKYPEAWQQAHARLYEYYKALPKNPLPETLEEMQPLFSAVAHGCAAELHQQALDEVYWSRISRKDESFIEKQLGAFQDNLACISHFFTTPWNEPAGSLGIGEQAGVLNWASFSLRALGRLHEAIDSTHANLEIAIKYSDRKNVSDSKYLISELQLALGEITQAKTIIKQSIEKTSESEDWRSLRIYLSTYGYALHQAGKANAALNFFKKAELLQQKHLPEYPLLYSLPGYQFCDLLLAMGKASEVMERTIELSKYTEQGWYSLLDVALHRLTIGYSYFLLGNYKQASDWLNLATSDLRESGDQDILPVSLLIRAALYRKTSDFTIARQDLAEVLNIAEPSGMRLHLTDYHLEMARLLLAEAHCDSVYIDGTDSTQSALDEARKHTANAAELITATGYHRRDAELEELQQQLCIHLK